eukprot:3021394-Prymnesium_polylepis.1
MTLTSMDTFLVHVEELLGVHASDEAVGTGRPKSKATWKGDNFYVVEAGHTNCVCVPLGDPVLRSTWPVVLES